MSRNAAVEHAHTKRAAANAMFGLSRESSAHAPGPRRPDLPSPEACKEMPYIDGVMPSFTQRVDVFG